ncbi:hypothetical protein [Candidatus Enterovibrio altilux]|uniref:Mobile element protein n=1 Tax=Candidatus Enterovibrio altilux TaxID=1927128 RepID=A0A291B6I2_9GAMM|nr:hypothetical protein [Candidatus Enterovibrio luxaltus]ATF08605.1 hypothetical protein BTN50_0061 [Candidatus Enterovibrio luxaltus]
MHESIAPKLSSSNATDSKVQLNLLKQTHRRINAILVDGADDTWQSYKTVRIKRMVSLILSKKKQLFVNEIIRVI